MAKTQLKKAAGARKVEAGRAASRPKAAVVVKGKTPLRKAAAAPAPSKKALPAKKAAAKPVRKPAPKPAAKPVKVAKAVKPAKAAKPLKAAKPVAKAKTPIKKAAGKPASKAAAAVRTVAKAIRKVVAKAKPAPAPKKPAAVEPPKPLAPVAPKVPPVAPAAAEKKRTRRPRLRITSNGAPAAAWLTNEKPRPASFIPAPPRAEAPSAIAAPPASSDRLIRPEDVSHVAVRTVPVRVDIEQGAGRYYVIVSPSEVTLKAGEGIEWDFRYLGGADVNVDEVIIEFEKPFPFVEGFFRTHKPGGARPHRQMSGGANAAFAGKRAEYVIRAMNAFKTEVARAKVAVSVTG